MQLGLDKASCGRVIYAGKFELELTREREVYEYFQLQL